MSLYISYDFELRVKIGKGFHFANAHISGVDVGSVRIH